MSRYHLKIRVDRSDRAHTHLLFYELGPDGVIFKHNGQLVMDPLLAEWFLENLETGKNRYQLTIETAATRADTVTREAAE